MSGRKIAIIDDDPVSCHLLMRRLEGQGYSVSSCERGSEAVAFVAATKPELILLDVLMPDRSGYEVLGDLRALYPSTDLPIIMCTAKEGSTDVVKSLSAGANDYLVKPITLEIAQARIELQLNLIDLNKANHRAQARDAIAALIVTYNHEINNPLTIALGHLSLLRRDNTDSAAGDRLEKTEAALRRIETIVRKIRSTSLEGPELIDYSDSSKMFKL